MSPEMTPEQEVEEAREHACRIVACAASDSDLDLCDESARETPLTGGWKVDRASIDRLVAAARWEGASESFETSGPCTPNHCACCDAIEKAVARLRAAFEASR